MTTPRVRVRAARPGDAVAIATIHVRTWQAAYRGMLPDALLDGLSIPERQVRWRRLLAGGAPPDSRRWVAVTAGAVAGFAATGGSRDADDDPTRVAEVYALYVAPAHWGAGVGRALFAHAVEDLRARGFIDATLWVLAANTRARSFYAAAGLTPDGATKEAATLGHAREVRYRRALQP